MNTIIPLNRYNLKKSLCFLFSGKAGVGKTYCSQVLYNILFESGYKPIVAHLAHGVKSTAKFMGWDGRKDDRGRSLLQGIGQVGRLYDENMWVRSMFSMVEDSVGYPYDVVIIDDWRFPNELEFIRRFQPLYHPISIRINSPRRESLFGTAVYNDISEISLDKFVFDYGIDNIHDGPDYIKEKLMGISLSEINKMIS